MLPTTQPTLLAEIRRQRAQLEAVLARIPAGRLEQPLAGDGWSVKDILTHIAACEQLMLGWLHDSLAGETPSDPSPHMTEDEIERQNAEIYQANRGRPLAEVEDELQRSYAAVLTALDAAPEAALMQPGFFPWTGEEPFAALVVGYTSDHYREHREQIAAWVEAAA